MEKEELEGEIHYLFNPEPDEDGCPGELPHERLEKKSHARHFLFNRTWGTHVGRIIDAFSHSYLRCQRKKT